jgi:NAD(P) transhydrogenase subunit alpha
MQIAVLKESHADERRVALSPEGVKQLTKAGFNCHIETGAGNFARMTDAAYADAGALIASDRQALLEQADVLLAVQPPTSDALKQLKPGAVVMSFLYAHTNPALVEQLIQSRLSAFALDAVPRISRAQKMDALSSQANLAGYKAVLLGANALGKIFPLMMTAAGTITPARVVIFGAGVAGLQAIATAKRLGAVVEVTDVRPETKEQVESLGGRFISVDGAEAAVVEGGYAKEVSAEYLQKQKEIVSKKVAEADLVITTALVMGKRAPLLVTEEMVRSMKPGSVIVDMAVESGGNCALSQPGQTYMAHGVTIIGETNLPALLATNASELYSRNVVTLLLHVLTKDGLQNTDDEITTGVLITHSGQLVHAFTKNILQPQ